MSNKDRVKFLYRFLVRMGYLVAARKLLRLLQDGFITLGVDDNSWIASEALEQVLRPQYSSNGATARFYLRG